jgi:hypothetical protein
MRLAAAARKAARKNPRRAALKACPFDGGKARLVDRGGHLRHAVECYHCHASTTRYGVQSLAVLAWNRRGGQ